MSSDFENVRPLNHVSC